MDYTRKVEAMDGQRRIESMFHEKERKLNQCVISNLIKKKNKEQQQIQQQEESDDNPTPRPNPFESDLSSD